MSVLPDHEIASLCRRHTDVERYVDGADQLIDPFDPKRLQPASYDVTLDVRILVPTADDGTITGEFAAANFERRVVDLAEAIPDDLYIEHYIGDVGYVLFPGQCALGSTVERVCISRNMVGRIEGKSSLGRLFLTAHITAGYLDPGFRGNVTLEIVNMLPRPVRLRAGMSIAQLSFDMLRSTCARPYGSPGLGSHYQDAVGVEATRYGQVVEHLPSVP